MDVRPGGDEKPYDIRVAVLHGPHQRRYGRVGFIRPGPRVHQKADDFRVAFFRGERQGRFSVPVLSVDFVDALKRASRQPGMSVSDASKNNP
jgi:hypothetical protein